MNLATNFPTRIFHVVILGFVVIIANGCDSEWPPRASEISSFVLDNSEQLERLELILVESGFDKISRSTVQDRVQVQTGKGANSHREALEGKQEWNDLLWQLKAYNVEKRDDGFWFLSGNAGNENDLVTVAYIHDPAAASMYDTCADKKPSGAEGECVVKADDEWFVYFWWYPND